jgi:hypothetical protein
MNNQNFGASAEVRYGLEGLPAKSGFISHFSQKRARYPDFLNPAPSNLHVCGFH